MGQSQSNRNHVGGPNVTPCPKYKHDKGSAWRKLKSDVTVSVGPVSKQLTGPHNPKKDAYRNCKNCGKHKNFHKKDAVPAGSGRPVIIPQFGR